MTEYVESLDVQFGIDSLYRQVFDSQYNGYSTDELFFVSS